MSKTGRLLVFLLFLSIVAAGTPGQSGSEGVFSWLRNSILSLKGGLGSQSAAISGIYSNSPSLLSPAPIPLDGSFDASEAAKLDKSISIFLNRLGSISPKSPGASVNVQAITRDLESALKLRLDVMMKLAKENPDLFLKIAAVTKFRAKLPQALIKYAEQQATIRAGIIEVFHVDDFEKPEDSKYEYYIRQGNTRLSFYPTGQISTISGAKINAVGFKIKDIFAANTKAANFKIYDAPKLDALGEQKTLVLLVNFQDSGTPPFTKEQAKELIFNGPMNAFYKEQSYGKTWFAGDVYGWFTLQKKDENVRCGMIGDEALKIAEENEFVFSNIRRFLVVVNPARQDRGGGCSTVGEIDYKYNGMTQRISVSSVFSRIDINRGIWTYFDDALSHELGHSLGLYHANGLDCGDESRYGSCINKEYGNPFDVMGYGSFSLHFNAIYKERLDWLDPKRMLTIENSGTYAINTLEADSGVAYMKIKPRGRDVQYYIEWRKAVGFDRQLDNEESRLNQNGLLINIIKSNTYISQLIDASPSTLEWYEDAKNSAMLSRSKNAVFVDEVENIRIGPILSIEENILSFEVDIGEPVCFKRSPVISFEIDRFNPRKFTAGVQGNNSPACGKTEFFPSMVLPDKWSYSVSPNALELDKEESGFFRGVINIPEHPLGYYRYVFRVSNKDSELYSEKFSTVQFPIKILSPKEGDIIQKNSLIKLIWQTLNIPRDELVSIDVLVGSGDSLFSLDSFQTLNDGDEPVSVSFVPGKYYLKVSYKDFYDISDPFTIADVVNPLISVSSPSGGETFRSDGAIPVRWQTQGISSTSSLMQIDLLGTQNAIPLATSTNDGEEFVRIPSASDILPGSSYYIRVSLAGDKNVSATSSHFSLQLPPPNISISAHPASTFSSGSSTISWVAKDASDCAKSGGWSGRNVSSTGKEVITNITANTSFSLTCTGPGGSNVKSAVVKVDSKKTIDFLIATIKKLEEQIRSLRDKINAIKCERGLGPC